MLMKCDCVLWSQLQAGEQASRYGAAGGGGMRLGREITVTPPLALPSSMATDGNTART